MNVTLDSAELADLKEALQAHTKRLLDELTHADQRKYREMLRGKLRRFEELSTRLEPLAQGSTSDTLAQ